MFKSLLATLTAFLLTGAWLGLLVDGILHALGVPIP